MIGVANQVARQGELSTKGFFQLVEGILCVDFLSEGLFIQ